MLQAPGWIERLLAFAVLAFASVQAGMIAHEVGHGTVTKHEKLSNFLGNSLMTLVSGLSYRYFNELHREHHAFGERQQILLKKLSGAPRCTNEPKAAESTSKVIRSILFSTWLWLLVCVRGITLKAESLEFMLKVPARNKNDILFFVGHIMLWIVIPGIYIGISDTLINYLCVALFTGPYLGAVLTLNHVEKQNEWDDYEENFLNSQLATTQNLGESSLENFIFSGLNHHVEHHLFPGIPRGHLLKARQITREFCGNHHLMYKETSFVDACIHVIYNIFNMHREERNWGQIKNL